MNLSEMTLDELIDIVCEVRESYRYKLANGDAILIAMHINSKWEKSLTISDELYYLIKDNLSDEFTADDIINLPAVIRNGKLNKI